MKEPSGIRSAVYAACSVGMLAILTAMVVNDIAGWAGAPKAVKAAAILLLFVLGAMLTWTELLRKLKGRDDHDR